MKADARNIGDGDDPCLYCGGTFTDSLTTDTCMPCSTYKTRYKFGTPKWRRFVGNLIQYDRCKSVRDTGCASVGDVFPRQRRVSGMFPCQLPVVVLVILALVLSRVQQVQHAEKNETRHKKCQIYAVGVLLNAVHPPESPALSQQSTSESSQGMGFVIRVGNVWEKHKQRTLARGH
ncbi:hypothetical protein LSAT2_007019 [Lamellibrachia satsuma]|nr:hypothetical protein LSAT2_007019 [Lamellibrachia satsuma]